MKHKGIPDSADPNPKWLNTIIARIEQGETEYVYSSARLRQVKDNIHIEITTRELPHEPHETIIYEIERK